MLISELIVREELIGLLADLVTIKSVNPAYDPASNEKEIADHIRAVLSDWRISAETQEVFPERCNVIARIEGKDPSRNLVFEAHMDTVSVQGMSIDPFRPEIRDGLLYGRGSCDTKAGLAAMLYALKTIKKSGLQPSINVLLAATVDEEHSFKGVSHLVRSGLKAEGAVVSEPTDLEVIIAHKGVLRWRIVTKGRAAHSSKVHLGINAIAKMARVLEALENNLIPAYQNRRHPLLGCPTLNVGLIRGGIQVNTVPDRCEIEVDRRLLPGEDRESVWREFSILLNELRARDSDFWVEMEEPMLEDDALETSQDEVIVAIAREACGIVCGKDRALGVPYGTDASKLSRGGIPSIVLGPGSIDQAHSAVEYVDINQVVAATEIYTRIMLASQLERQSKG